MPDPTLPPAGLAGHLAEAIRLNRARRPHYARLAGPSAWVVSTTLVGMEAALLPLARRFDRAAVSFQQAGTGVVFGDVVPMAGAAQAERRPVYTGRLRPAGARRLARTLRSYRRALRVALRRGDLLGACALTEAALVATERAERRAAAHLAMTRHVLESIGFAAANGVGHAEASGGATLGLTRRLVAAQARTLPLALRLDRWAQRAHARGAGVLVNDLPPIPFREAWALARAEPAAA